MSFLYGHRPLPQTAQLLAALRDDPRFTDVAHRHACINEDRDTLPIANVLDFTVAETGFVADVRATTNRAEARIEVRRVSDARHFVVVSLDADATPDAVRYARDRLYVYCLGNANPQMRVTDYGARLVVQGAPGDVDAKSVAAVSIFHHRCGGHMQKKPDTTELFSLSCRQCHLRVLAPTACTTIGELMDHFAARFGVP